MQKTVSATNPKVKYINCAAVLLLCIAAAAEVLLGGGQIAQPKASAYVGDPRMQSVLATELKNGIKKYNADAASAVLINAQSGRIEASLGFDTFTPDGLQPLLPIEPGSVMKPLTIAFALESRKIISTFKYLDTATDRVGDLTIHNATNKGAQWATLQTILSDSLNTGAVRVLKTRNGGQLSDAGCSEWYEELRAKLQFGQQIDLGQPIAAESYLPDLAIPEPMSRCAETAYGIGLTVSPVHLAAAYTIFANNGTGSYLNPCVKQTKCANGKSVLTPGIADEMRKLLIHAFEHKYPNSFSGDWIVGAKSGTAPRARDDGTYNIKNDNGTYVGFIENTQSHSSHTLLITYANPEGRPFASSAAASTWIATAQALINHNLLY